jgi:hypothetical protein
MRGDALKLGGLDFLQQGFGFCLEVEKLNLVVGLVGQVLGLG